MKLSTLSFVTLYFNFSFSYVSYKPCCAYKLCLSNNTMNNEHNDSERPHSLIFLLMEIMGPGPTEDRGVHAGRCGIPEQLRGEEI